MRSDEAMPKEPKVYGSPVGPAEKKVVKDRPKPARASDASVHAAVKAANEYRNGREAPPRSSSPKAAGPADDKPDTSIIDTLKYRGKRIDDTVEGMSK
jgi:hypothetical protein